MESKSIPNPTSYLTSISYPTSILHQHHNSTSIFNRKKKLQFQHRPCRFGLITAAAKSDYYTTLNLTTNATLSDIKTSYRNLARKYHPDMSKIPGSEEKFKEISAAYEVLSNEEKRAIYDRFGEAGVQGFAGPSFTAQEVDPFEFFDSIFGDTNGFIGGEGVRQNKWNLDIWSDLDLAFEESVLGGRREIEIPCFETCGVCDGTGSKSSNSIKTCNECEGRGRVMIGQRTPFGVVSQVSTCLRCRGAGRIVTDKCLKCKGQGNIKAKRTFDVVIPPGVINKATMQLRGEGNFDRKRGVFGDLYLTLNVEEKKGIWREGLNLCSRVSINYTEAVLGTVVKVDTVEGSKELQIPSGVQPGDTIKLSHLGIPKVNERGRGDHVFIVDVRIPKCVSDRERELLKELSYLVAESEAHSTFVDGQMDKGNTTKHRTQPSYLDNSGTNVWNHMERLFRSRPSGAGFSCTTMTMTPTLWKRNRQVHQFSCSWVALFLFSCVFVTYFELSRKYYAANTKMNHRTQNLVEQSSE